MIARRFAILLATLLAAALPSAGTRAVAGDYAPGEKLTLFNCGRCHVVNEKNRMGGIGSTPSFPAIRSWPNWEQLARTFYTRPPHRSFTQVKGVTEPFPIDHPPHVHPIELTLDDIDRIVAFMRTIPPKDLGGELRLR